MVKRSDESRHRLKTRLAHRCTTFLCHLDLDLDKNRNPNDNTEIIVGQLTKTRHTAQALSNVHLCNGYKLHHIILRNKINRSRDISFVKRKKRQIGMRGLSMLEKRGLDNNLRAQLSDTSR